MSVVLILGCGYSGLAIARELMERGHEVVGTRRDERGLAELRAHGIPGIVFTGGGDPGGPASEASPESSSGASGSPLPPALTDALLRTTHLVSSVAPARTMPLQDPVLDAIAPVAKAGGIPRLEWIGYLSTIGVYGNRDGGRVDEDSACTSVQPRSIARLAAEVAWQALGARAGVPVAVLRLSGIYGPGRNAVIDALAGRARMLIKPGQVFNRIHVDDIGTATALAAERRFDGVLNISDDEPAPPQDIVRHAHALTGRTPPEAVDFETAEISAMARSFYAENKRVDNARSRSVLGLRYRYPDYRVGLAALAEVEWTEEGMQH